MSRERAINGNSFSCFEEDDSDASDCDLEQNQHEVVVEEDEKKKKKSLSSQTFASGEKREGKLVYSMEDLLLFKHSHRKKPKGLKKFSFQIIQKVKSPTGKKRGGGKNNNRVQRKSQGGSSLSISSSDWRRGGSERYDDDDEQDEMEEEEKGKGDAHRHHHQQDPEENQSNWIRFGSNFESKDATLPSFSESDLYNPGLSLLSLSLEDSSHSSSLQQPIGGHRAKSPTTAAINDPHYPIMMPWH